MSMLINPYAFAAVGGGGVTAPPAVTLAGEYWAEDLTGLSDTDPVGQFDDRSGNAAHMTETSPNRPTYVAASTYLNGRPAVAFDGVSQRIETSALSASAPWEYVLVGRIANRTVGQKPFETGADETTASKRESDDATNPNTYRSYSGSGPLENTAEPISDAPFIVFVRIQSSGGLVRVNGVDATGAHGTRSLGSTTALGWSTANSNAFTEMEVVYFAVKASSFTTTERDDIEAWAADVYGVTLAL